MSEGEGTVRDGRFLVSGDESGTAPGDRPFRPDVEGLRAVAVLLVVLYHSGVAFLSGGYIGVDVFFVISGFVITGVLLRERSVSGSTSVLAFYGRRCRRIIPAASVVVIAAVALSFAFCGAGVGGQAATDGRWATVFLANFHFSAIGTNYLTAQSSLSPLQNFWSLGVEEQFYVVYPTLFLVLAAIKVYSLRARLALALVSVITGSLAFSIIDTPSHPTAAYFLPFTRAWELAIGALVAVGTPWLLKLRAHVGAVMSWTGLAAILVPAVVFTASTEYPGYLVAIPVMGAALIITGGIAAPARGAEVLLGAAPCRAIGKISYSLYLWHWPILIIAAEHAGKTSLPVSHNLGWDLVAVVASVATYRAVEDPIRHAKVFSRRRLGSVGLGVLLASTTLGIVTVQSHLFEPAGAQNVAGSQPDGGPPPSSGLDPIQRVERLVAASARVRRLPARSIPPLSQAASVSNLGFPESPSLCFAWYESSSVPQCEFGDPAGKYTMVLYGDSHAAMWFRAFDDIAVHEHWKLFLLSKVGCPATLLEFHSPDAIGRWSSCDRWHSFAIKRIDEIDPDLLLISQEVNQTPNGGSYTPTQWRRGLQQLLARIVTPRSTRVILGNIPFGASPDCLYQHLADVQACATVPTRSQLAPYNAAERQAARAAGARYVDVVPWFCTSACSPVVGNYIVFANRKHVAVGYTRFLEGAMVEALRLSAWSQAAAQ